VPYPGLPVGIVIKQSPLPGYRVTSVQAITVEVSK
jgi:beta-lactam-binding protein with PASTA domain